MSKVDKVQSQVDQWRIDDDNDSFEAVFVPAIKRLPKELKAPAFAILNLDELGRELPDQWDEPLKREKAGAKLQQAKSKLDKLSAANRRKIFACFAPKIAGWMEMTWQRLKTTSYQVDYTHRPYRAAKNPAVTLPGRLDWLLTFVGCIAEFDLPVITLPWLAQWTPHAFPYQAECVVPLLTTALDARSKQGDEVYEILRQTVTREHDVGIMGDHVIGPLLRSNRQEGWDLIEKTLLAAQRQEGLRQSIVQEAHLAHPQAFQRMLRLIVDENLIRFSSVGRSINLWFGLLWDSVSSSVLKANVDAMLTFIDSAANRKQAVASDDAETVYLGLWAMAYHDAPSTVPVAAKLLKHKSDEIRYVATWILTLLGIEESNRAKKVAIDDANLQVALLAAVETAGLNVGEYAYELLSEEDSAFDDGSRFAQLEKLYARLPEKPKTLPAIVWPWTERKADRKFVAACLLQELGERPPTQLLPYLKGLDSWQQRSVIELLSAQKKWDKLTRATLFELAGHASADVREAAFDALAEQTLSDDERAIFEGYLSRTSADLRLRVVSLLLEGKMDEVWGSADRLLASGTRNRRLAGLEMLRQLTEKASKQKANDEKTEKAAKQKTAGRATKKKTATQGKGKGAKSTSLSADKVRSACQARALEYQKGHKKLTKDEQVQLEAIAASDNESYSLDDGFGLFDPQRRSEVVLPETKKVLGISTAALACLKDLDDLVHKHRKEIVEVRTWRKEEMPLGEVWSLPSVDLKKPLGPQRAKFPLHEVWEQWKAKRAAKLKDKDGFELLRAMLAAELCYDYTAEEIADWLKKPANKKLSKSVIGEFAAPKLRYEFVVGGLVKWLFFLEIPKGCVDFLLDCTENTYAQIPADQHQALLDIEPDLDDDDDDYHDWRNNPIFEAWDEQLSRFIRDTGIKLTKPQQQRSWQLQRFFDEPIPGAPRKRMPLEYVATCYQQGWATFDDVADELLGSDSGPRQDFDELRQMTRVPIGKGQRELLDNVKGLTEFLDAARERILEIELARGEAGTVASNAASCLESVFGTDTLLRTLATLGKDKFKVQRGWRSHGKESRLQVLTQLVSITYPKPTDTTQDFVKQVKEAVKAGYCSEERLLELAFLAPQWTKFVEAYLKWDGFSEALYWFIAHMSTWESSAKHAAAGAEGFEDDDSDDDDDDDFDYDDEDDDDDNSSGSIKKPRKLSAWERLVIERTPLTADERYEGAVDVQWFHRTWEQLGAKRWQGMAAAAKFSANSAQAKKAQFLGDVLLGNVKKKDLVDGIKKRNLKEYVRLIGLLPLEKGNKRDKDLMDRYEVLQAYKMYARGLSSLTKPEAFRALEIGFSNLARLAGYRDPLRLEWSLEAESVKDLAKGSVAVTKDGVTVTLSLDETAQPQITVQRGDKKLKSVPAATKKKHAAIRDLAERGKELRAKSSRMKQSLESAMCRGDIIVGDELVQLMQHAILAPQLSRLIMIGEGIMGYPDKGGKALRDHRGKLEPVKKTEQLRIAHPADLLASKSWARWQAECFQAERVQPFKQVFRELYTATAQEKKAIDGSSRFAGQQVGPRQALALWNSRGWNTQDEVFKTFHDLSLVADVGFQWNYGTAAEIEGLTLETVSFRPRDEYKPLKNSAVPPIVFSEVMRDVDLVVSVAHRGEVDPEASASTVEMRSMLIVETCKLLGLKNVKIKKSHAFIDGHYGEYSLHLGSGNVHRLPGGALAILPVHAQHRGRLFLPFADDDPRTAEVISKVLLLARDEEIQDPLILDQLAVPASSRKPLATDDTPSMATKSSGRKKQRKAAAGAPASAGSTATAADAKKKRYELVDGKSNKFWEIELAGTSVITSWGRIGTNGQSKTKTFADEGKAKKEYDRLVKEKTGKGYEEA